METLHHVMLCAWMYTALHRTLDEETIVKVKLRKGRPSPRMISHISISTHHMYTCMCICTYTYIHMYLLNQNHQCLHHPIEKNQMSQLDRASASGNTGPWPPVLAHGNLIWLHHLHQNLRGSYTISKNIVY